MLNGLLALTLGLIQTTQEPREFVIEGVRAANEAAAHLGSIDYYTFEVPPGVTKIEIQTEHDADNVVEIGIFDPRGHEKGGAGFRGWQGAKTENPIITGEPATTSPSYIAGPIQPGKWHIAQWYLKPAPGGLKYKYTVKLTGDGPSTSRFPEALRPPESISGGGAKWYAGHLRAHAPAEGIDFIVATAENTVRHHYDLSALARANPKVLVIPGTEMATPFGRGNVMGSKPGDWFDFRLDLATGDLKKTIQEAHKQGALFAISHPFAEGLSSVWRYPEEEWLEADAMEVWNGAWSMDDDQAFALWQQRIGNSKRRLTMVGAPDSSQEQPVAWVHASSLSKGAILKSVREGRVVLTQNAKMLPPELTVGGYSIGQTVKATVLRDRSIPRGVTLYAPMELIVKVKGYKGHALHVRSTWGDVGYQQGTLIESDDFMYKQYVRPGGDGFYRVEIRSGDAATWGTTLALTNPVYSRK